MCCALTTFLPYLLIPFSGVGGCDEVFMRKLHNYAFLIDICVFCDRYIDYISAILRHNSEIPRSDVQVRRNPVSWGGVGRDGGFMRKLYNDACMIDI